MKKITATLALLFAFGTAHAAEPGTSFIQEPRAVKTESEFKPHVGILMGMSTPEGSYESSGNFGIESGFQPVIPFGIAVSYSFQDYDTKNTLGQDLERALVSTKLTYHFAGTSPIGKTFVGIAPGLSWENDVVYGAIAPLAGIDIPLENKAQPISLGLQTKYTIVASDGPDTFDVNGIIKYWF